MKGADPVAMVDISERLGVSRSVVIGWPKRGLGFPRHRWTAAGIRLWEWQDVLHWHKTTQPQLSPKPSPLDLYTRAELASQMGLCPQCLVPASTCNMPCERVPDCKAVPILEAALAGRP